MNEGYPAINLTELCIDDVRAGLTSGAFTSGGLTQAFLDRIALYNPHYNAIIVLNPEALADARAIDGRRDAGEKLGPLAGVPVVVKDTMDMIRLPTTGGWHLLCSRTGGVDLIPAIDSSVVARMRSAGAIILGKTNVPVLSASTSHANDSWAGPTCNAAGREFLPGGSRAATATAVAASMGVLGLAEETGGSIQNPASAQALVGVKPSFGLVPTVGVMPLSGNRDVVGPIARCVRDAALALDVLAGDTADDPKAIAGAGNGPQHGYAARLDATSLSGKRLGLYGPGWRDRPLSGDTEILYRRAMRELQARGAMLLEDPFFNSGFADIGRHASELDRFDARGLESAPYDLERYLQRLGPDAALRCFAEFAAATAKENPFAPGGVLALLCDLPQFAACLAAPDRPPDLSDFFAAKTTYLEIFASVMDREQLDALVFPQMRGPLSPLHGSQVIQETTVSEINIAGLPGITVPAGYYASGAPFGLIFVGRMWSERLLLSLAYDYECATKHRRAPALATS